MLDTETQPLQPDFARQAFNWISVILLIYLLISAVSMVGAGFKSAAGGEARALFEFASNPILGLMVGILATALIQSSSTVTSIIVGLVAGGMPVMIAIPMVMGANIGTTITNTIVGLGHARNSEEFRRAFAAATVHDYFNVLCVLIFLPLELATGFLDKIAAFMAQGLLGGDPMSLLGINFMKTATVPVLELGRMIASPLPAPFDGIALIAIGIGLIFGSILLLGRLLKTVMIGRAKRILHSAIGKGPISGIVSGAGVTVLVQSSSTTTSLMVPLAGTGLFSLRQIYPFTLGANIGTCITALLAAVAVTGDYAIFALEIALVHLLYNTFAVVLIYGVPFLRDLPIKGAEWLADVAATQKLYALAYVLGVFFLVPGAILMLSR
ncbi:MAG: Na/Pi symporter [Alphaproteobacteria bacterium]